MSSLLNIDEFSILQRAKFTRAQIATQQQKFYNLFRIAPLSTIEVSEMRKLREKNDELLTTIIAAASLAHHESAVKLLLDSEIAKYKGTAI